jgi:hypothetical protein
MRREKQWLDPRRRQQFFAWVLLLVYLPTVFLTSVHVHSLHEFSNSVDCAECQTGLHHSGHITTDSPHHDECLSCRFLGTQVVVPEQQNIDLGTPLVVKAEVCQVAEPISRSVAHPSLRAPPVIL